MRSILLITFSVLLAACASDGSQNGSPVIRSQDEADAYNLTVNSPRDFVYCRRVEVTGTNLLRTVCGTVDQLQRELSSSRLEAIDTLNSLPINN